MIIHDAFDALLMATLTTGTSGGETLTSEPINITEPGGSEAADLIITAPAADQVLTLKLLAADAPEGEYAEQLSWSTTAEEAFSYRGRLPKYCPQYIKLQVETGSTAPSEPAAVTLRVAM